MRGLQLRQRLELVCQREGRRIIVLYRLVIFCQSKAFSYSAL